VRTTSSDAAVYDLGSPLGSDATAILAALRRVPGAVSVEPDLWMTADALPNDPYASQLWGLLGAADGSTYGVDARSVWGTTTGTGVVVAVIDTGLVSHTDLAGQSVAGYDMIGDTTVSNDGDGRDPNAADPGDWCGEHQSSWHGTHVAGTIAALANNAIGVFGGAPGVKIEPVRVLGTCGGYLSDVADGVRWAAGGTVSGIPANPTPARVLNLSLGGSSPDCTTELASAIADARSRGGVVVVAAGNGASDAAEFTPANCPDALTVAAIDSSGMKASFSNYGALVDVAGPGVGVISTIDSGTTGPAGPTYASYSGTSMATPHVTLSAALVAAAYPSLAPNAIEVVLEATTTGFASDASATGCPALGCGTGIVNAGRAIARLAGAAPIVGRVAPSVRYPAPGSSLSVTAYAVDRTGVASAQRNIDGGTWAAMSAADGAFGGTGESLTVSITAPATEGTHTICVRATDPSANTSDGTTCTTIIVDGTAPSISGTVTAPSTSAPGTPIVITATATDALSGVASAAFSLDGGAWGPLRASDDAFGSTSEGLAGITGGSASALDAGGYHACVLSGGGTVVCWGNNYQGELGDGTRTIRPTPVPVSGLTGVTALDGGGYHTCALLGDGTVRCWGANWFGQLGDGTTTDETTPVPVIGLTGVVSISAGVFDTCALLGDGTVKCWGLNNFGQLGDGTTTNRTTPVSVVGLAGAIAVSAGSGGGSEGDVGHTCALLANGAASCWGDNSHGQLGDGTTTSRTTPGTVMGLTGAVAVSAGFNYTCALLAGGTTECWGWNWVGELGNGDPVWDTYQLAPTAVVGVGGAIGVSSGLANSCALLGDGTARCWGWGLYGQLGDGTYTTAQPTPVTVSGLVGTVGISVGSGHSCAILGNGTAKCWGWDAVGGLGDGTTTPFEPFGRATPVAVVGLTGALPAGPHTVCVRATDTAGNTSAGGACSTFSVSADITAPTVRFFVPTTTSPTTATSITYSLAFREPVTGLAGGDFSVGGTSSGWTVSLVSGSGAGPYIVTLTGTSPTSGTVSLTLKANSVTDLASNVGPTSPATAASVTVDRTAPTVTLARSPSANPSNAASFTISATWSESVTGFVVGDVSAANGTVSAFSGSGATFGWTVTPSANGTVSTTVAAGAATDLVGNVSGAATSLSWTSDRTAPALTTPVLSPNPATPGAAVTVTASATDALAVASAQVSLAGGAWTAMSAVDGAFGGTSEALRGTVTAPTTGGTYSVCVRATDSAGNTSTGTACAMLTVSVSTKTATVLTYTGSVAASPGATITLSATLKTSTGTALAGKVVTFTLNGKTLSATTTSAGLASVKTTAPTTTGSYTVGIAFAGDTTYAAASKTATLVVKIATALTYTGPTAAAPGATITLSATLKTSTGTALAGKTVSFTLNGVTSSATTNSAGVASVARTAPATTGSYTVAVAYAGDTTYGASTKSATLVVRVVTKLTYTGPTAAVHGTSITLSATLKTAAGTAISGKSVTFKLNGKTFAATTNSSGLASVTTPAPTTAASYTIAVAFAGDTTYAKASASATLKVS
jgi:subtilisin family serine protease/alpha-tubulin suppressor-like RCC1 family protein